MSSIKSESFLLEREKATFKAGICLLKSTLPELRQHLHLLHPEEKAYHDYLKYDKRKLSYLLGRMASKKAIAEIIPEQDPASIEVKFGIFQFPVVKHVIKENIQVSISHCDNIGVAIAFPEEHPMGVDIEAINSKNENILKRQVHESEVQLMLQHRVEAALGYTMLWSMKEALSKIIRTGLTIDYHLLKIETLKIEDSIYSTTFKNFGQYKAISFQADQYVFSLVLPGRSKLNHKQLQQSIKQFLIQ